LLFYFLERWGSDEKNFTDHAGRNLGDGRRRLRARPAVDGRRLGLARLGAARRGRALAGHIDRDRRLDYLGRIPLDLRIAEDGTWRGTIGPARAAGRAYARGDDVILEGTAIASGGKEDPVYFRLTGDDARRWGTTLATFPGREPAHAEVSLTKDSSA
jgi:hypothetical protein